MPRVILLVVIGLICQLPLAASSAVLTVDCAGGGDFLTVQEAIAAAANRDTIRISACTYTECLTIPASRSLTLEGEGVDATVLTWPGPARVITLLSNLTLRNLGVRASSESASAIGLDYPTRVGVTATDVRILGFLGASALVATRCSISRVGVGGQWYATFESCRIGHAGFGGIQFQAGFTVNSHLSTFGEVVLGPMASFHSVADSIGYFEVPGGLDVYSSLDATGTRFGRVVGTRGPDVTLTECDVSTVEYALSDMMSYWLGMTRCLVRDAVTTVLPNARTGSSTTGGEVAQIHPTHSLDLVHNTILGDVDIYVPSWCAYDHRRFASNIVLGSVSISTPQSFTITNNDFLGSVDISVYYYDPAMNMVVDPLFCGRRTADYALQDCSPCVGTGHDGGDVGAFGAGCPCWTAVERASWGGIKAMFRQPSN